jgi:hypothetical protein
VRHVIDELAHWKRRGRMRKVFFWDAIFTLDLRWMDEFAEAYRSEIGLPFECYTHPHAMSRDMARALARAGDATVRIGVQTVNSDTLAAMDRKGDRDRVEGAVNAMRDHGIAYSLDHILGLPGETADDQRDAIRFYNAVRPGRVITHWMTYFPGTTAIERARTDGLLSHDQVERILSGEQTEGFEAPRLVGPGDHADALREIDRLAVLFEIMPLVPRSVIDWLLTTKLYAALPNPRSLRTMLALVQSLVGDVATRERFRTMFQAALWSGAGAWLRRARPVTTANVPPTTTRVSTSPRPSARPANDTRRRIPIAVD